MAKIGIDLGTCNSIVFLKGKGIALSEPTVVAVSIGENRVLAVGKEAKDMMGKTPDEIEYARDRRHDGQGGDVVVNLPGLGKVAGEKKQQRTEHDTQAAVSHVPRGQSTLGLFVSPAIPSVHRITSRSTTTRP